MSAYAAAIVAVAAPPNIAAASAKNGAGAFTSVLAQLALVGQAAPRPVPTAPATASQGEATPQKPGSRPRHTVSQQAAPAAVAATGQAATSTPPVAPAGQSAGVAPAGAENDGDVAQDDTIAAPDAASRAGPPAAANRHQGAAAEATGPDAAGPAPSFAQGADAGANITAPTAQATTHAGPVTGGAAALAVASIAGPGATGAHAAAPATAPALVTAPPTAATQLAHATAIHFASGTPGQITIHLQPAELGAVQVRIERGHDGSATITVQVERADTMHALQADLPHLHQALDRAGVPAEARQVHVELAQAPPAANGGSAGGEGQRQGQAQRTRPQSAAQGDPDETAEPITRWRPAGINITA